MRVTFVLISGALLLLPHTGSAQTLRALTQTPEAAGKVSPEPAVLTYAEEMPAFPGGEAGLHAYLAAKTAYPAEALRRGLSGTVVVSFVVDGQGRVLDPVVVKASSPEFNEEAIRLARLMPWWTPGRQQGQPVRVRCTLPIQFTFRRQQ